MSEDEHNEINGNSIQAEETQKSAEMARHEKWARTAIQEAINNGYNFVSISDDQLTLLKNNKHKSSNIVPIDSPRTLKILTETISLSPHLKDPLDIFLIETPRDNWQKTFTD
jgi:hypothetical protein